ncbi:MAG: hypothetical protein WC979_01725 [Candidatus Pacearchaeota archaeon]|jgi:hypothetical protein|nr:hypothetical protein [Clostridia bacterium]
MEINEKQIKIARTKSGTPCLWESYTEFDNLKRAIVVIGKEGEIKNSIFIRQFGSKQSLIPIDEGDHIVKIFNDNNGTSVSVLEIKKIANSSNHAEMLLKYREATGSEQSSTCEQRFNQGIKSAKLKMEDKNYIASKLFEKNTTSI